MHQSMISTTHNAHQASQVFGGDDSREHNKFSNNQGGSHDDNLMINVVQGSSSHEMVSPVEAIGQPASNQNNN
jgi:hypothetical protein